MEIFLDCLPCVLRQVLEASRMATDDAKLQAAIMAESIQILSSYPSYGNSPALVGQMHQTVKRITGVSDPYRSVKQRDIRAAQRAYPDLKQFLDSKQDQLYWALKIAATGNIMDSAIYDNLDFEACLENELAKPFTICDLDPFKKELCAANTVLIIGDNAGETVFDRVLMEHLVGCQITYAVRHGPVINDATIQDAHRAGLQDFAEIITTGSCAPGAVLSDCSTEFLNTFDNADVVISKGQGNFEALSDAQRSVFFLLKAKCHMIAGRFGVHLNDYVFQYHNNS